MHTLHTISISILSQTFSKTSFLVIKLEFGKKCMKISWSILPHLKLLAYIQLWKQSAFYIFLIHKSNQFFKKMVEFIKNFEAFLRWIHMVEERSFMFCSISASKIYFEQKISCKSKPDFLVSWTELYTKINSYVNTTRKKITVWFGNWDIDMWNYIVS